MSFLVRILLFFSSYFPAFVIIAILYWRQDLRIAVGALVIGSAGLVALICTIYVHRSMIAPTQVTVARCRRNDAETMTYVLSYLVPFVGGILEGTESAIAYLVFFAVIGVLYANSNMIHINPMLNLFGYRLYDAVLDDQESYLLLSRRQVLPGEKTKVVLIGDVAYLEVK